jgi:hypothetical protein
MEKYRKFDDPGTGKNPHIPCWMNYRSPIAVKVLRALICYPFGFVRLVLIICCAVLVGVANVIYMLIPLGILRRPVQRILDSVLLTIWMVIGGFAKWPFLGLGGKITETHANYRRLKLLGSGAPNHAPGAGIPHGCAVFTTYQSFFDILYFTSKMSPVYAFPSADGAFTAYNFFGALAYATDFAIPANGEKSLAEICQEAKDSYSGPVIVFAEGERTNGSCIMAWPRAKEFSELDVLAELPAGAC